MFKFHTPEYLYLLLLIPALVLLFVAAGRNRRRRIARFGDPRLVEGLMPDASPRRVRNKFIIYLAALALVAIALARPQTGARLKEVSRQGVEIMVVVDVSNSMLAQDFEPNRLERTKFAINRVLEGIEEDRIGVIVFAGDAYVQLPITSDYVTARSFVSQISPNMVTKQGTAIGSAISLATSSFTSSSGSSRAIVLITDGENHEDDAIAAARHAASQGIKIYVIGIGTPEGAPIPYGGDYIRDEDGEMVVTHLDEKTLQQIAIATEGVYIPATNESLGFREIIDRINETEKSNLSAEIFEEYDEQFQWFLAAALLLLLLEELILSRKNKLLERYNIFK